MCHIRSRPIKFECAVFGQSVTAGWSHAMSGLIKLEPVRLSQSFLHAGMVCVCGGGVSHYELAH